MPVNWCPALGTVLANEEVIDGKSERGDHPVVSKRSNSCFKLLCAVPRCVADETCIELLL